jgi:hypothetical protein
VKVLRFRSGDERDGAGCLRATDWRTPRFMQRTCHLGGDVPRPGVFQVVKTTQSRARTGRTLPKALLQLRRRSEGFRFLERKPRKGLSLRYAPIAKLLKRGDFCSPQARPREARECCGRASPSLDVTFMVCYTESSGGQALMLPGGWRRMRGQDTPVQGQTEPSWQNGADVWCLLTH